MVKSSNIAIFHLSKEEMNELRDRFSIDHNPSVLSFPEPVNFIQSDELSQSLGEIYLCPEYIEQEASVQGIAVRDHEAHLLAHGVLHVLGFNHDTDSAAEHMEEIERRILH